jgi:predicted RNA methylase
MQTVGLNRNTIDKYYTKPAIVDLCALAIRTHINPVNEDFIIEPSAGGGAFIDAIKQMTDNYAFYDLEPGHPEIQQLDYLCYTSTHHMNSGRIHVLGNPPFGRVHVIGNPPFGRQSSMAIKFIKKSAEFCDTISFILPKSFKKTSMQKAFPPAFHLVYEIDLPDKSFTVDGTDYTVPCVFQIWEKRATFRQLEDPVVPINYAFVKKTDEPHISFRRVGVNAGVIDTIIENKSEQSHYFIKFSNGKSIEENMANIRQIQFNHNNTVGPKSIGKQELIKEWNKIL